MMVRKGSTPQKAGMIHDDGGEPLAAPENNP
jgi:hypothetical protein